MAIQINGDGTITGISVGGLPDGIVDTDMIAASAVTPAKSTIQGGKILQFKQAEASGQHSSADASGNGADVSGMSQSFTLTSSSNKVVVMISCNPYIGGSGTGRYALKLFRDTTMIFEETYANIRESDGTCKATRTSYVYLDNPADTNAHTYKVALKKEGGSNTVYLFDEGANSHTITLMEVDVS